MRERVDALIVPRKFFFFKVAATTFFCCRACFKRVIAFLLSACTDGATVAGHLATFYSKQHC